MRYKDSFFIRSIFDSVADKYDLMNTIMSLGREKIWKDDAVNSLISFLPPSACVLDLAGGTGDISKKIKRKTDARVVIADLSQNMLEKAKEKGLADEYIKTKAEKMPFEDEKFDAVICAFGLRNFEEPIIAIKEMNRVMKTGGVLIILELTKPEKEFFYLLHSVYTSAIPLIGKIVAKDFESYKYLVESISNFPSCSTITSILGRYYEILSSHTHRFGCMKIIAKKNKN